MCRLLETIKLLDGQLYNLPFHNARLNNARKALFGASSEWDLRQLIRIPADKVTGLFRCRVVYDREVRQIEFLNHVYRPVHRLKLIEDNAIDYRYKYADRTHLHHLFEQRGEADDILIVRNGHITDSYTANPIFFDGRRWWTPDTPLLPGTQRARLLADGKIAQRRITPDDLRQFQKAGLINALQDMNDMPVISIEDILF